MFLKNIMSNVRAKRLLTSVTTGYTSNIQPKSSDWISLIIRFNKEVKLPNKHLYQVDNSDKDQINLFQPMRHFKLFHAATLSDYLKFISQIAYTGMINH